jgi:hypothetical protein
MKEQEQRLQNLGLSCKSKINDFLSNYEESNTLREALTTDISQLGYFLSSFSAAELKGFGGVKHMGLLINNLASLLNSGSKLLDKKLIDF